MLRRGLGFVPGHVLDQLADAQPLQQDRRQHHDVGDAQQQVTLRAQRQGQGQCHRNPAAQATPGEDADSAAWHRAPTAQQQDRRGHGQQAREQDRHCQQAGREHVQPVEWQ